MCPLCPPAGTTTPTPMPGRARPRGAAGRRHSTLWTVRAVAAMVALGECPGAAGRRRASPWASSQHARGALHGSTARVSGRCVCDSVCWHQSLRCAGVLYHREKNKKTIVWCWLWAVNWLLCPCVLLSDTSVDTSLYPLDFLPRSQHISSQLSVWSATTCPTSFFGVR